MAANGCRNNFTLEATVGAYVSGIGGGSYNPASTYTDYPPYLCFPDVVLLEGVASSISDIMLLNQYANSTNLKEYIGAFVQEVDTLFEEVLSVHYERLLPNAIGSNLDILGEILGQPRGLYILVDKDYFGFNPEGDPPHFPHKMADEATPADGGWFKGEGEIATELQILDDEDYRKILLCRAYCLSKRVMDYNTIYEAVNIMLGFNSYSTITTVSLRYHVMELNSTLVSVHQVEMLEAIHKWFTPMGVNLEFSLV